MIKNFITNICNKLANIYLFLVEKLSIKLQKLINKFDDSNNVKGIFFSTFTYKNMISFFFRLMAILLILIPFFILFSYDILFSIYESNLNTLYDGSASLKISYNGCNSGKPHPFKIIFLDLRHNFYNQINFYKSSNNYNLYNFIKEIDFFSFQSFFFYTKIFFFYTIISSKIFEFIYLFFFYLFSICLFFHIILGLFLHRNWTFNGKLIFYSFIFLIVLTAMQLFVIN